MPEAHRKFAIEVVEKLRAAGFEAYFAGGCVRDELLGLQPVDYDVATSALPDQVREIFPKTVGVGEAFNVMLVLEPNARPALSVEVASFRKDVGISDGRHPTRVDVVSAEEDVKRRDFTINGMLYDPIEDKVLDWVGGKKDLENRVLRSIGTASTRIQEDYLRMLRAVRFAARFQCDLDKELECAILQHSTSIRKISAERIFEELSRILTHYGADQAFEMLADLGLLKEILPEALEMKGVPQPPEYHPEGDVWVHTMLLLKQLTPDHPRELGWGCLLHDVGKPRTFSHEPPDRIRFNNHARVGEEMADHILKRLKASRKLRETVCELVADHLKFADVKNMRESTRKRFLRNPNFDLHLEQHRIDCLASHENLELYEFCKSELERLSAEMLKPEPLLRGRDLISLGLKPGPEFKAILEKIENQQLEGLLNTKEEALDYVKTNFLN